MRASHISSHNRRITEAEHDLQTQVQAIQQERAMNDKFEELKNTQPLCPKFGTLLSHRTSNSPHLETFDGNWEKTTPRST
jgi:hypothetical protein